MNSIDEKITNQFIVEAPPYNVGKIEDDVKNHVNRTIISKEWIKTPSINELLMVLTNKYIDLDTLKINDSSFEYTLLKASSEKGLKKTILKLITNDSKLDWNMISKIHNIEQSYIKNVLLPKYLDKINIGNLVSLNLSRWELVWQYKKNKKKLLKKLWNSKNVNIGWNKDTDNFNSLTEKELLEIFMEEK